MKTILFVSDTFRPEVNGVTNTLNHWISHLQQKNYKIKIIRPKQDKNDVGNDDELTIKSFKIPAYSELKFGFPNYFQLKNTIESWNPDVVYIATEGLLGLLTSIICRRQDIPCISGFHTNFHKYGAYYKLKWLHNNIYRYLRFFHNFTDATLVPTTQQKRQLETSGFERVNVLSRGVDSLLFNPKKRCNQLRKSWKLNSIDNDKVVLYVGRLANEKNIELAVDSFREIQLRFPSTKMVIVGNGPLKSQLEMNNPDIIFPGVKRGEELASFYASSDIFLFPSLSDTFGNVVLEAMASGLAVIGFDEAAIHEHSYNGQNNIAVTIHKDRFGHQIIDKSNQEFINVVSKTFENPYFLNKLQLNARNHIEQISWSSITSQLIEILFNENNSRKSNQCKKQIAHKSRSLASKV